MAQVMEAVASGHGGFERRVAIKRLLPQHARDGERRRMFFEEARIGSRMHHGGIVPILDYGLIDGSEFMAMEYVEGLDALRAVSSSTPDIVPMPEGIALHVTAEIAHALAYIHDLRDDDNRALAIVHRDVSPPNILLSWNGDVKLSDFGIALSRADDDDRRQERQVRPGRRAGEAALHGARTGARRIRSARRRTSTRWAPRWTRCWAAVRTAREHGGERQRARSGGAAARPVAAGVRADPVVSRARCAVSTERGRRRGAGGRDRVADAGDRRPQRAARVAGADPRAHGPHRRARRSDGPVPGPGAGGGDGARTFTISRAWQTPGSGRRRRRTAAEHSRKPLIAAAMLTAAFAATVFAWRTVRHSKAETMSAVGRAVERLPAPHRPIGAPERRSRRAARPRNCAPAARYPRRPRPPADAPKRGWVRVGGEALVGARVETDGIFAGYAPLELSLPVGSHMIVATSRSGHVLVHKHVHLEEAQTRLVPLRILR